MWLDDLFHSEWFYRSPGPISIVYYGVIILLGARLLQKRVTYRRWKWVNSLTESFFLNGFIVLSADLLWMLASGLKFLPSYPDSFCQVVLVLARDCVGMVLCFLLVGKRLLHSAISFKESTAFAYFTLIVYLVAVFGFASDPSVTDWTYAVRQGLSTDKILASLIFSYGLGKVVSAVLVWSWWN